MKLQIFSFLCFVFFITSETIFGDELTGSPRLIAEWEPAIGTMISYPHDLPVKLIQELAKDGLLFVFLKKEDQKDAQNYYQKHGVNINNIRYKYSEIYTPAIRDAGPTQLFDKKGIWSVLDPIFQGWAQFGINQKKENPKLGYKVAWSNADQFSYEAAISLDAPVFPAPFYFAGGNFLVDGLGTAFCTQAMLNENIPIMNENEFRGNTLQLAGVERLHVLNNVEEYGIQHIDCWFKLLDEERILIKKPPIEHPEYNRIEENIALLRSLKNPYGRPYHIFRIYCPTIPKQYSFQTGNETAAYTNSIIVNQKVLVPLFGISEDQFALQTWRRIMPGYEVIGIEWKNWGHDDSLHCAVRQVYDRNMLYISHPKIPSVLQNDQQNIPVLVTIDDRSELGLKEDQCNVYFKSSTEYEWNSVKLQSTFVNNLFTASIPPFEPGTVVEYYIEATDYSGRRETLPRTTPQYVYEFMIEGENLITEFPVRGRRAFRNKRFDNSFHIYRSYHRWYIF